MLTMKIMKLTMLANATLATLVLLACTFTANGQPASSKALEKPGFPLATPKTQSAAAVEIKLARRKVSLVDANEIFQDASTAKPGEILEESAIYTNKSKIVVTELEATLPIPFGTELMASSTKPAAALVRASTDGMNFQTIPLKRKVKLASGIEVEQAVPLNEYRFLRWYPGELAAGKSLTYSARFKIVEDTPQAIKLK